MERPSVVCDRFYYGHEIIRDVNDLQPLNENAQYSRTETSACNRQIYHGNLTENSEPTDLRESRHRALTRQAIQGSVGTSHGSRFNEADGGYYVAGHSSESTTRNHHGYGHPLPTFGARHRAFTSQSIQGGVGAGHGSRFIVDDDGDCVAGPSSASNTLNHHGYGHPLPTFGARHRDLSRQPMQGLNNYYNDDDVNYVAGPSSASNNLQHHGYGHSQLPFGARHRDLSRQGTVGHYNVDDHGNYAVGPSCESGNRNCYSFEHPRPPSGSRHRDFSHQAIHALNNLSPVYDNVSTNENYVGDNERNKLVKRIIKYYEEYLPLIYLKNIEQFNKSDWLKVSFISRNGMKIFQAEMFCPICRGKISPQNKEKEAGRVPKWDLYAVKRHLILVHKVQQVEGKGFINDITETAVNNKIFVEITLIEETINQLEKEEHIEKIAPTEETMSLIEKTEETIGKVSPTEKTNDPFEEKQESIEKIDSFVVENKFSDKKVESLDELDGKEVEKLSGAKDFVSYLSLAASSDSGSSSNADSNNRSDSEDSETATKKNRGAKKLKKKRTSTRTRNKRQSPPETKSSRSKRRKVK